MLKQTLDRRVTFNQDKKTRTLTLFAAGIEQLVAQFVKGDRHARRDLFDLADKLGLDLLGSQRSSVEEALPSNHQAILQTYLEKQYDRVARRAPVLAPPELLDDDLDDQNRK